MQLLLAVKSITLNLKNYIDNEFTDLFLWFSTQFRLSLSSEESGVKRTNYFIRSNHFWRAWRITICSFVTSKSHSLFFKKTIPWCNWPFFNSFFFNKAHAFAHNLIDFTLFHAFWFRWQGLPYLKWGFNWVPSLLSWDTKKTIKGPPSRVSVEVGL